MAFFQSQKEGTSHCENKLAKIIGRGSEDEIFRNLFGKTEAEREKWNFGNNKYSVVKRLKSHYFLVSYSQLSCPKTSTEEKKFSPSDNNTNKQDSII